MQHHTNGKHPQHLRRQQHDRKRHHQQAAHKADMQADMAQDRVNAKARTDTADTDNKKKYAHILCTAQQRQRLERQYRQKHRPGHRANKKEAGKWQITGPVQHHQTLDRDSLENPMGI